MEIENRDFYKALATISRSVSLIYDKKHPKFLVLKYGDYIVVTNDELAEKFIEFTDKNIETINEIFPKEFKCFKPDEILTAKLVLISMNCKENYQISCATKFDVINDKLYAFKMLSCKKSKGLGFVMLKYDLIEDDAALGRFMYMNQSTNDLLQKIGGICVNVKYKSSALRQVGYGKAGVIRFTIKLLAMFDPTSSTTRMANDKHHPNRVYVDTNNYEMVKFDSVESVKNWIGSDGEERCPFINFCSIKLISKYLRIRKWINRLCKPDFTFFYEYVNKKHKA